MRIKSQATIFLLISTAIFANAQQKTTTPDSVRLSRFQGSYFAPLDTTAKFNIALKEGHLELVILNQGSAPMDWIAANRFSVQYVNPKATVEFLEDSSGQVNGMLWQQPLSLQWNPVTASMPDKQQATGSYRMSGNPNSSLQIKAYPGRISIQAPGQGEIFGDSVSPDHFETRTQHMVQAYSFRRNKKNEIVGMNQTRTGGVEFVRDLRNPDANNLLPHVSNRQNGFNRGDTLRGSLNPWRTCYDVLFYDLQVEVFPDAQSITGTNTIRFRVTQPFRRMQIDLYANMTIDSIIWHGRRLSFTREYDAVFLDFPDSLTSGSIGELTVSYNGRPQTPNLSIPMHGGFLWLHDQRGKLWIETVVQGSGASVWWPCKDHLSDKPDSMRISVTVPEGLQDISNGRLIAKTPLSNNRNRFVWYVSYPIVNYNVVLNIGDYTHFTDTYTRNGKTLALNYYCMPYNEQKARQLFSGAKPMLERYEKWFGPYPFERDGFTVMESLYPMEHQSAVSIGRIDSKQFDEPEMSRLMWHESVHEWWGNSVTCSDMADFWLHEAFARYTEFLTWEALEGKQKSLDRLNQQDCDCKEPIIGVYGVNDIHRNINALYDKGSMMLNTLRSILNNDSLWFGLLRGWLATYKYGSVTTEDFIRYVHQTTGTDYTYFFDQYLRQSTLPVLELRFTPSGDSLAVEYRWTNTISGFHMPVKAKWGQRLFEFIYPDAEWKTLPARVMRKEDVLIDRRGFYIEVREAKPEN